MTYSLILQDYYVLALILRDPRERYQIGPRIIDLMAEFIISIKLCNISIA